jgi:20S proteasome alpha/beta subunit
MTVALALICSDGVLVASDSMASDGPVASNAVKVHCFADQPIVWTASGSVFVIEEAAQQLAIMETKIGENAEAQAAFGKPDLAIIRQNVAGCLKATMAQCYGSALPFGNQQQVNGNHPFITDFVITGYTQGMPYLLEVAHDGQVNWHYARDARASWSSDEGFCAIGSGGAFASVAQGLMKHYLESGPLPLQYGMQLAYRTIETACEVSSMWVRTPVQLAIVDEGGARLLDHAGIEQLKDEVAGWKQLERDALWRKVSDVPAEELETPPTFQPSGQDGSASPR